MANETEVLKERLLALEVQNATLARLTEQLRRQVERCTEARAKLKVRAKRAEDDARKIFDQYAEAEERGTHFANLFLTADRFHGVRTHEQLCAAIRELVENLIGSEEIAIFKREGQSDALVLLHANGIDATPYTRIPFGGGIVGAAALTKEPYFASPASVDGEMTACVPLMVHGRVVGALALFRLLPQKSELIDLDRELLDVLATHAGAALAAIDEQAEQAEQEAGRG